MVAIQITMYSDGLSRRSARAISRARLAPKSRCSTTLLSCASASLDWSAWAMPWLPPAASGFSSRVDAYRASRALTSELPPDIATPNAIRRIARAATAAMTMVIVSTS